jgi:hypothetical protein
MPDPIACPNCDILLAIHPWRGACVLGALIVCIRDREEITEAELRHHHAQCDVDALWDRLGPIIDDLQEGVFDRSGFDRLHQKPTDC